MKKNKTAISDRIINAIIYVVFFIFMILCIYPFYYLIINTISANDLSANGLIMFLPKKIHFHNYTDVIKIPGLSHAALVSIGRTLLGTMGTLFGSAFLGFMFTQEDLKGRRFWYRYTVITMYIGAGLIPWYLTMMNLHLTNNFWAYVLPAIVQPFNIILVKTYIESTPKELQEAAKIDGAGTLRIFASIVTPISKPILATVAIFSSVGQWNAFQDTLILMTNAKYYTLQYVLYQYINQSSSLAALIKSGSGDAALMNMARMQTPTSVRMTVTVIVVVPILIVYPIFQRFYVKGIMIGSVKG